MIGGKEFSILICFWRHAQKGDDSQWYFFPLRKSNVLMNLKEDTLTSCFSHWCHQLNCEYIHRLFIWYRYSSKGYNNSQALKMEENSIQVEILNVVAYERISCFRVFVRNLFCFWYLFYSFFFITMRIVLTYILAENLFSKKWYWKTSLVARNL